MARQALAGPRKRLNLDVSLAVNDRLSRLREKSNAESISEVIRRSLAVYERLIDAAIDGYSVIIIRGEEEKEILLPESKS